MPEPEYTPHFATAVSPATARVFQDIARERAYQDRKWGGPEHDATETPPQWMAYRQPYQGRALARYYSDPAEYRRQIVKLAALAVAEIEALDRAGLDIPHGHDPEGGA